VEVIEMTQKAKVLLVDDDKDFVEATKMVLESKPYEVLVAYNGDEGLAKARKEKPDLIILDIIMPVKDGFTAAEQLKKDPDLKKIPVIMLTSFAQKVGETSLSMSQGLTLDTEDYVDKPVSPQELLKRVERLLKK
jgi:CheY-like chemotaxis protein